jgi:uridine kinase
MGTEHLAQVILLTGPSGSGKSYLAARSGLPVLRLDDFYRDGGDPALPWSAEIGAVDWDHPDSWNATAAIGALEQVCRTGSSEVPVYDHPTDRVTGIRRFQLGDHDRFIAEGVFAAELVADCRSRALLADAIVVTRSPELNFVRRLVRDLSEGRDPPAVLWRRGWHQLRTERAFVRRQIDLGCRPCGAAGTRQALAE